MAVDLSLNTNCFSMTICLNELPSYNLFWRVLFSSIEEFEAAEILNFDGSGHLGSELYPIKID